jgi:O-antigen/teichoic acid export membrane protein
MSQLPAGSRIVQPSSEGLTAKAVKGSAYSIMASAVTLVLGLGRSILMARLLAPEDFGVVAFALTFLNFTFPLRNFGLDLALIHRKVDEDSPLDEAMAAHFSLRLVLIGLFVLLLLAVTPVLCYFYPQKTLLVPVLMVLTVGEVAGAVGATPITYLRKEMRFKELAVLQVLTSLSMTIVGPLMAWQGWGVWAIVGEKISGAIGSTFVVWIFFRPWRMRWQFQRELVKWYWKYGKFVFVSQALTPVVTQFDGFWIGSALGDVPLGLYSKAYEFAQYPHRIIGVPIAGVALPAFAQGQNDRLVLSKSYFRFSSFIIRLGFLVAGVFVLIAREFVTLVLGARWTPMVLTFQIMAVYMLLQPFFNLSTNLMVAVGRPRVNMHTLIIQAAFFVPAVILANKWFRVNGVAVVTNLVLIIGLAYMLRQAKDAVDFSFKEMVVVPSIAFLTGGLLAWLLSSFASNEVVRLVGKALVYTFVYNSLLLLFERKKYVEQLRIVVDIWLRHRRVQLDGPGS